jgi:hypothetical protein
MFSMGYELIFMCNLMERQYRNWVKSRKIRFKIGGAQRALGQIFSPSTSEPLGQDFFFTYPYSSLLQF